MPHSPDTLLFVQVRPPDTSPKESVSRPAFLARLRALLTRRRVACVDVNCTLLRALPSSSSTKKSAFAANRSSTRTGSTASAKGSRLDAESMASAGATGALPGRQRGRESTVVRHLAVVSVWLSR